MQKSELTWELKSFGELSALEVHDLLKVRVDVFVVEQECAYEEIDGMDPVCWHVLGKNAEGRVVATSRVAPAGSIYPEASIGRIAVDKSERGKGLGKVVTQKAMDFCITELKVATIKIAAQLYLKKFYSDLGFVKISDVYLWDGIEHIDMRYSISK